MRISICSIILLLSITGVHAQEQNKLINKGNEAYKLQQYDKAGEAYKEALEKDPNNVIASFNMGNALFKEKKFEEAAKVFEEAAKKTTDKQLQAQLFYNKGVALTQQKKLEQSIESYKQSLRINPIDTLARENLQRALNEKKQKEQQENQQQNQQKEQKENQPKPKQNKLNQQQVQQLLKALEEQEKKLQEKATRKPAVAGQPDKDW